MAQKVPIRIANTHAAWFYQYAEIPKELRSGLENLLEECKEKKDLRRELRSEMIAHPREPIFFASATLWRKKNGLEKVALCEVAQISSHSIGYRNTSEASLWFADKHGHGEPNYLGWGVSNLHGEYLLNVGKAMTAPEAYNIMRAVTSLAISRRIRRPADHILYAEVNQLTPEPTRPERKKSVGAVINNNRLVMKDALLGSPQRDIDVWSLYHGLNGYYMGRRESGNVDERSPIPYSSLVQILGEMGFKGKEMVQAVEVLVDADLLAKVGTPDRIEGYRPTQQGVAIWRALDRRI